MPEAAHIEHLHSGTAEKPPSPAVDGSSNVFICGKRALRVGDRFQDGTKVESGAPHVMINGKAAARKGDKVTGGGKVDQGCSRVNIGNGGGPGFGKKTIFDSLTDPKDKLIMCMPEMAAAESELANDVNRQGWLYLYDLMLKWRSKPAYVTQGEFDTGGQEPYMVEWDWLMEYARFRDAVAVLTQRAAYDDDILLLEEYLFSSRARASLVRILRDCEDRGCKDIWQHGGSFDHSSLRWDKLRKHAFQNKATEPVKLRSLASEEILKPDGLQASIGKVTAYALAAGEIEIVDNVRRITVRCVYAFIHDGFDFSDEQWLGNWECSQYLKGFHSVDAMPEALAEELGAPLNLPSRLDNKAYRNFRQRTGFGCDFRVMCVPQLAWQGEFRYDAP